MKYSDPSFLILISLSHGPKHGYAMLKDIKDFSGAFLGPGTLYSALERLKMEGMIERIPTTENRHPYRLTVKGLRFLMEQLLDLYTLYTVGMKRLNLLKD